MTTTTTTTTTRHDRLIDECARVMREWRRGSRAEYDQFRHSYLSRAGHQIVLEAMRQPMLTDALIDAAARRAVVA